MATSPGEATKFLFSALSHNSDECLLWEYARNNNGYGIVRVPGYTTTLPHRIVCMIVHGLPPTGKHQAAHTCGNGHNGCINYRHLVWKTATENSEDKKLHGTYQWGETHPNSKLKYEQAYYIKHSQEPRSTLAKMFNTSVENVRDIQNGRRWRNLK